MEKPGLISLTFDDGLRCQFERAIPILDQYGFSATFFLVANTDLIHTDGGDSIYCPPDVVPHPDWPKINWNEEDRRFLRDMIRQGHEVGAHSVTHRRPELDDDPKLEAEGSKKWIEDRLGVEILSYCYPFYHLTEPIKNAVINAGYKQARWGTQDSFIPRGSLDWFAIDCHQISKNEVVGLWLRPGCWRVLTFHGIGNELDGWEPITVDEFARQMSELAELRDSGAAEVVTFKAGAERLRQPSLH